MEHPSKKRTPIKFKGMKKKESREMARAIIRDALKQHFENCGEKISSMEVLVFRTMSNQENCVTYVVEDMETNFDVEFLVKK